MEAKRDSAHHGSGPDKSPDPRRNQALDIVRQAVPESVPDWHTNAWDEEGEDELSLAESSPAATVISNDGDVDGTGATGGHHATLPAESCPGRALLRNPYHEALGQTVGPSARSPATMPGRRKTTKRHLLTKRERRARAARPSQLLNVTDPESVVSALPFSLLQSRSADEPLAEPSTQDPRPMLGGPTSTADTEPSRPGASRSPASDSSATRPSTPLTHPDPSDPLVIAMTRAPHRRGSSSSARAGSSSVAPPSAAFQLTRDDLERYRSGRGPKSSSELAREVGADEGVGGVDWARMSVADAAWRKFAEAGGCSVSMAASGETMDAEGQPMRPEMSVPDLIRLVIAASPRQAIKVDDIYQAFENRWAYYRTHKKPNTWKDSIRHALSYNEAFKRVAEGAEDSEVGKGYWRVARTSEDDDGKPASTPSKKRKAADAEDESARS